MNFDIKLIAGVVSLLICFAGIASTWALLQYRIEQLEKEHQQLAVEMKNLSLEFGRKGEEVKCLICKAHEMQCPGC